MNNKSKVLVGNDVKKIFDYAKNNNFAVPAINCINTDSINVVLESANKYKSPVIIQFSYSGSSFFSGYEIKNNSKDKFTPSIIGAISGALYIHNVSKYYDIPIMIHTDHCDKENLPWLDGLLEYEKKYFKNTGKALFSSHMLDLSNESLEYNISTCLKYFNIMNDMSIMLEFELGCTGNEKDIINNSNDISKLYTNPEDILYSYKNLKKVSENFLVAAAFGNVHGVYKKGDVKLNLNILKKSQDLIFKIKNIKNCLNFVFHGGSGSSEKEIKESIKYGVVKINIDTDIQWATWQGILNYYKNNKNFLQSQVGNLIEKNIPNKKYYDPRSWIRYSQLNIIKTLKEKFKLINSYKSIL